MCVQHIQVGALLEPRFLRLCAVLSLSVVSDSALSTEPGRLQSMGPQRVGHGFLYRIELIILSPWRIMAMV